MSALNRQRLGAVVGLAVVAVLSLTIRDPGEQLDRLLEDKAARALSEPSGPDLVRSEELLLSLVPHLRRLSTDLDQLALPGPESRELFAPQVTYTGLENPVGETLLALGVERVTWQPGDVQVQSREEAFAWLPLLRTMASLEFARFEFLGAHFSGETWSADLHFEARGQARGRGTRALRGVVAVEFAQLESENSEAGGWRIQSWKSQEMEALDVEAPLFAEVTSDSMSAALFSRVQRSLHEEKIVASFSGTGRVEASSRLEFESFDRHPGVSVVDIDGDGVDEIYLMARWGKNLLLRQSDGQWQDVAPDWGLDFEDHCTSALFADFDNDGDPDLLLGRSWLPSLYLVQDEGRFHDRSVDSVEGVLPGLVSSISAADYDGDGLLDIYLSTYASSMLEKSRDWLEREGWVGRAVLEGFLPPSEAARLGELLSDEDFHFYLNRPGPENVLLHNEGQGRFSRVTSHPLLVYKNTYQAAWADYDGDGDADLYLANDFSLNHLFRNEGDGQFADVTEASATSDYGFGMGVSWRDYDNDGLLDLYVSNMYSRAGNRITASIDGLDSRMQKGALGNSLLRNRGFDFERSPGEEAVARAGWSWGGQFADFDNDGREDLYVASGYYSAPEEVAIDRDT